MSTGVAGTSSGGADPTGTSVLPCERPFDLQSTHACQSNFEGYEVKFVPLAPGKRARAISLYFHGDTAVDWEMDYGYSDMARWSYDHDVAFFAVRSEAWESNPGEEPWRVWYNTDEAGSLKVSKVIDAFAVAYRPTSSTVLYAGASGGSIYLTDTYLTRVAQLHPGVIVANCGASPPMFLQPFAWDVNDAVLRGKLGLYYNYGSEDFLAPQIEDSYTYFLSKAFAVHKKVIAGVGHCEFDSGLETTNIWATYL